MWGTISHRCSNLGGETGSQPSAHSPDQIEAYYASNALQLPADANDWIEGFVQEVVIQQCYPTPRQKAAIEPRKRVCERPGG